MRGPWREGPCVPHTTRIPLKYVMKWDSGEAAWEKERQWSGGSMERERGDGERERDRERLQLTPVPKTLHCHCIQTRWASQIRMSLFRARSNYHVPVKPRRLLFFFLSSSYTDQTRARAHCDKREALALWGWSGDVFQEQVWGQRKELKNSSCTLMMWM